MFSAAVAALTSVVHCFAGAVSFAHLPGIQVHSRAWAGRATWRRPQAPRLLASLGVLVPCIRLATSRLRRPVVARRAAPELAPEPKRPVKGSAPDPNAKLSPQEKARMRAAAIAKAAAAALKQKSFDPKTQLGVTEPLGFWDPVGICPKDETVFNEYRACEIKHGRVAMMATLGALIQHFVRIPGFTFNNFGQPLPSGLKALSQTPGTFGFVVLFAASGVLELTFWKDGEDVQKGKWTKEPGNFGDPLGLGQYTEDMRNREINNGRFAMFAAMGIIAAELATGKDAVEQLGL